MKRSWTITFFQHEQEGTAGWGELLAFVKHWNENETPLFYEVMGFMWHICFEESNSITKDKLLGELDQLREEGGVIYHLASRNVLEEQDYSTADFIELLGVDLGSESQSFVLNEREALSPLDPCLECGWNDVFDVHQEHPFVIDERLLDLPSEGRRPGRGGWDVVNLPGGHKVVSQKVVALLRDNSVEGYKLHQVIDGASGVKNRQISSRMFQLLADTSFLAPCLEHTQINGKPFCAVCGTGHGEVEGFYWLRNDLVSGKEVISRHPAGGAMLYVSRHLYELMVSAGVQGLNRNEVLLICDHLGRGVD